MDILLLTAQRLARLFLVTTGQPLTDENMAAVVTLLFYTHRERRLCV